jgi:hypothetical protein
LFAPDMPYTKNHLERKLAPFFPFAAAECVHENAAIFSCKSGQSLQAGGFGCSQRHREAAVAAVAIQKFLDCFASLAMTAPHAC